MTNLAILTGWDKFDEKLYFRYLKAINNVDNTLSSIHSRSVEENQQDRKSRLTESSKVWVRFVGGFNYKN
jgi:hypothetical protein